MNNKKTKKAKASQKNDLILTSEYELLAKKIGSFIEYWGFKNIQGRIWCLLFLSKTSLCARDLSQLLKVSKTLLSFAMEDLLNYQVIIEDKKGLKRTIYYKANPNLTQVITGVLKKRELQMLQEIMNLHHWVDKSKNSQLPTIDPDKLDELKNWIQSAQDALQALILFSGDENTLADQFHNLEACLNQQNQENA